MLGNVCFTSHVTEHALFDDRESRFLLVMLPEAKEAEILLAETNATIPILRITIKKEHV